MLIVSLPPIHQEELLKKIISHPLVGAVRYNTGMDSAYSPEETLNKILVLTKKHDKILYIDLKGPQLRVAEWSLPPYGPIVLNNKVAVELPAKVYFRGDKVCELKEIVDGNKIFVDPLPRYGVGRGQAINIVGKKVKVKGLLTENDKDYIKAAVEKNIYNFMLSFVESLAYIASLENFLQLCGISSEKCKIILKIESKAGMEFIQDSLIPSLKNYHLMAARDDLMIQVGRLETFGALRTIIQKDPWAICASRLLLGLESEKNEISLADISDIELMRSYGYKNFMFSDGISLRYFDKAIEFWKEYVPF